MNIKEQNILELQLIMLTQTCGKMQISLQVKCSLLIRHKFQLKSAKESCVYVDINIALLSLLNNLLIDH